MSAAIEPSHHSVPAGGIYLANAHVVVQEDGSRTIHPLAMVEILDAVHEATAGWPRRVGDALFVHKHGGPVQWLGSTDALFGWLGNIAGRPPEFHRAAKCHSQGHVFAELKRTAVEYQAVESLPHEPPIAGHYYACQPPVSGDGAALQGLIERYEPASAIDGDLIAGMFASALWGGAGGTRPAFVISSDSGRGAGKTTLANHVAYLAGGAVELSANEDAGIMKQRLLSPEGQTKRVAILDNVKTLKFSWADLESLITAPTISGKRLYVGEGTRPNNLLWLITLNGVSLSKDLAQRAVIVKLGKPQRSGVWAEETRQYIDQNRSCIIADCIALLRRERHPLERYSRWASWERDVLERLPEPAEAQSVILDRQHVADVEDEEAGLIQEHFAHRLRRLGYDVESDRVFLPSGIVAEWYCEATRERTTTTSVSRKLKQAIDEGSLTTLVVNRDKRKGRGFVWWGEHSDQEATIYGDIESRVKAGI